MSNAARARDHGGDAAIRPRFAHELPLNAAGRLLWDRLFWGRHALIAFMGVLPFFDSSLPNRVNEIDVPMSVAAWLLLVALPLDVLHHLVLRRRGRLSLLPAFTDQLIVVVVVLLEPGLASGVFILDVVLVGTWAAAFGAASSLIAAMAGLAGMVSVIAAEDPEMPSAVLFFLAVGQVVTAFVVGSIAQSEHAAREEYEDLIDGVDAVVWRQSDPGTNRIDVTAGVERLLGFPAARWQEENFGLEVIHRADLEGFLDAIRHADEHGSAEVEYRVIRASGGAVRVRDRLQTERDENGGVRSRRGVIVDVTDQWHLATQAQRFAEVVEHIPTAVLVAQRVAGIDRAEHVVVAANPEAGVLLRRDVEALVGLPLAEVSAFRSDPLLRDRLEQVIVDGGTVDVDEYVVDAGTEFARVVALHAFALPDRAVGITFEDVTRRTETTTLLRKLAMEDTLTGLGNRNGLADALRAACADAERNDTKVALLAIDLDGFKEINDALGHEEGDRVLVEAATRLRHVADDTAAVFRTGGDEFALLLRGLDAMDPAIDLARRVTATLDVAYTGNGLTLPMRGSIGLSVQPDDANGASELSRHAEVAMYHAKRRRRPFETYVAEDDPSSLMRVSLAADLRAGIERDELVLHFQPAIDLRSGRTMRAEALVRWRHPTHGLLPPSEFVDLAETTGLMPALTRWVVLNAILEARDWMARGHAVGVAVNLSARDLADDAMAAWLADLLSTHGLPVSRFSVEVTESELMEDPDLSKGTLRAIRSHGVRAAIDDFGTGYASLAYLRDLPADEIKIDRSFVMAMGESQPDATIVRATVGLGHNLGLEVVAEGVEDASTLERLTNLGCDTAQGYHIARPMPSADFVSWLDAAAGNGDTPQN